VIHRTQHGTTARLDSHDGAVPYALRGVAHNAIHSPRLLLVGRHQVFARIAALRLEGWRGGGIER
jgi:hypothetical protein